MRILVTGGAGFVGSQIVDALLARGDELLVVDDLSSGKAANLSAAAGFQQLDVGDPCFVALAERFGPEAVVHAAAQASVATSMHDPARDARTNILGGLNVVEAARATNCPRFLYVTTGGALYGVPEVLPAPESHPIRPLSAYGLSKWTFECYLRLLLPESTRLAVLRLANVYGPRQDAAGEAGVIAVFADRMRCRAPVVIHDDGEQTRDFVYVADVARAALAALDADEPLTLNISSGRGTSVNEVFRLMARASGYELPPAYGPRRPGDVRHSVLDNTLARERLCWRPEVCLEDGLRRTMEWMRSSRQ
jgi:UDP-glucose 4-epimerase